MDKTVESTVYLLVTLCKPFATLVCSSHKHSVPPEQQIYNTLKLTWVNIGSVKNKMLEFRKMPYSVYVNDANGHTLRD